MARKIPLGGQNQPTSDMRVLRSIGLNGIIFDLRSEIFYAIMWVSILQEFPFGSYVHDVMTWYFLTSNVEFMLKYTFSAIFRVVWHFIVKYYSISKGWNSQYNDQNMVPN